MGSLTEDTIADKLFRFVLGALLGAGGGWFLAVRRSVVEVGAFTKLIAAASGLTGVLAVVFGNAFIEGFIRGGWWDRWWDWWD